MFDTKELYSIASNFETSVNKLARIQYCVAELEGMKAANADCALKGEPPKYVDEFFNLKNELIDLTRN